MGSGYQSAGLKRRQFAHKVKWYIGVSTGALLFIGLVYAIGFSSLFSIEDDIEVVGAPEGQSPRILDVLRPQVVAGTIGGILGADNYFSWSDTLEYQDVRSSRVSIEKNFWSRHIKVIIHPRERYGVWCLITPEEMSGCSWIDASGVAFESAPTPDGQLVIAIFEPATTTSMVIGDRVIKEDYFAVIRSVTERLAGLRLPVSGFVIDRGLEEIQVKTISGTKISFSLRFDPSSSALPALEKLIDSPGLSGMRSVDFTVENRVFYTAK